MVLKLNVRPWTDLCNLTDFLHSPASTGNSPWTNLLWLLSHADLLRSSKSAPWCSSIEWSVHCMQCSQHLTGILIFPSTQWRNIPRYRRVPYTRFFFRTRSSSSGMHHTASCVLSHFDYLPSPSRLHQFGLTLLVLVPNLRLLAELDFTELLAWHCLLCVPFWCCWLNADSNFHNPMIACLSRCKRHSCLCFVFPSLNSS